MYSSPMESFKGYTGLPGIKIYQSRHDASSKLAFHIIIQGLILLWKSCDTCFNIFNPILFEIRNCYILPTRILEGSPSSQVLHLCQEYKLCQDALKCIKFTINKCIFRSFTQVSSSLNIPSSSFHLQKMASLEEI